MSIPDKQALKPSREQIVSAKLLQKLEDSMAAVGMAQGSDFEDAVDIGQHTLDKTRKEKRHGNDDKDDSPGR